MRRALFVFALLAGPVAAQVPIDVGSRVRLLPQMKYEPRRAGRVVSLSGDSVLVRFEPVPEVELRAEALSVPRTMLEVRVSSRRYGRRGAAIGAVTLGLTGMLVGRNMREQQCWHSGSNPTVELCDEPVSYGGIVGLAGAIGGAGVGSIIGFMIKTDRWMRVDRR